MLLSLKSLSIALELAIFMMYIAFKTRLFLKPGYFENTWIELRTMIANAVQNSTSYTLQPHFPRRVPSLKAMLEYI